MTRQDPKDKEDKKEQQDIKEKEPEPENQEEEKKVEHENDDVEEKVDELYESVEPKRKPYTKNTLILLLIIPLIAAALIFNNMAGQTITTESYEITESENTTTIENILPETISYAEYLANLEKFNKKDASIKGRLRTEVYKRKLIGIYEYYAVDDDDSTIGLDNIENYDTFFPENGTTDELFEITGMFTRDETRMRIEVTGIKKTERSTTTNVTVITIPYTINKTITHTEPKYPGIRNLVDSIKG